MQQIRQPPYVPQSPSAEGHPRLLSSPASSHRETFCFAHASILCRLLAKGPTLAWQLWSRSCCLERTGRLYAKDHCKTSSTMPLCPQLNYTLANECLQVSKLPRQLLPMRQFHVQLAPKFGAGIGPVCHVGCSIGTALQQNLRQTTTA